MGRGKGAGKNTALEKQPDWSQQRCQKMHPLWPKGCNLGEHCFFLAAISKQRKQEGSWEEQKIFAELKYKMHEKFTLLRYTSKDVWNFSENSLYLVAPPFP